MTDRTAAPRLGWLDALRGFAALVVAWFHVSPYLLGRPEHLAVHGRIDLGKYGVLVFFLVSGYVIPMSLERHGSLRRFWVGRVFRIYPAYLVSVLLALVAVALGVMRLWEPLGVERTAGLLGHATMLVDLLGLPGVLPVYWTLSYEMVFYLVVAGLFAWGVHRASALWAGALAVAALVGGSALPNALLSPDAGGRQALAAVMLVAVGASVLAYLTGRRAAARGAGLVGVAFLLVAAVNGASAGPSVVTSSWQAVLMLATMFAGTVVYRMEHGGLDRRLGAAVLALVAASTVAAHQVHSPRGTVWYTTTAAVVVTVGVAFLLRHRRVPAALSWLGAVSFSVYLLHLLVLVALTRVLPGLAVRPAPERIVAGLTYALVTLGAASLVYRWVELPGQALGRRVTRLLDERLPGERLPGAPPRAAGTGAQPPRPAVPPAGEVRPTVPAARGG